MNPVAIIFGFIALVVVGYLLWLGYTIVTSPIPFSYNYKSVVIRWRSTSATILVPAPTPAIPATS
jgi:threonine/homoserine/homoserine lactone efflux protein